MKVRLADAGELFANEHVEDTFATEGVAHDYAGLAVDGNAAN